ncbi:equilibrative nucleotide transporter 8 [Salvia miltiorrhiza]|uniref:equilibrative nucleotide transporter 8 n=1 Tax=Salvia miltiorrhiza TaxID=226208 RepID=UPI0025AC7688|nr:equilibrative nucleotide transporter 8 [Salvia miltiorrhiza]
MEGKMSHDKFKVAYILHFFLGAGNLLPWNALITAVDYFGSIYPGRHVERVFSVVYMGSSLLLLVLLLNCPKSLSLSVRLRLNLGFSMFLVSLMATPLMNWTCPQMSTTTSYYVVVLTVMICGFADGLIGGTLIGAAGKLPKHYMQAVFAGTASSGVLISILRVITKASLPPTPQGLKTSAEFYFVVGSAALILCIIICNLLYKLPVMQHHYTNFRQMLPVNSCSKLRLRQTFKKIRFPAFGVLMIYTVTLSIFPGFLAENIKSQVLKDWYPIALIATYNLSDFVGKAATAVYVMEGIEAATWWCVARLALYPLFVGCFRGPEWLRTEAPVVVLTLMLGFSNGYLTSVLMILAPKAVPEAEAEVAAIVMAVMLAVGLVAGSVIGWFWVI